MRELRLGLLLAAVAAIAATGLVVTRWVAVGTGAKQSVEADGAAGDLILRTALRSLFLGSGGGLGGEVPAAASDPWLCCPWRSATWALVLGDAMPLLEPAALWSAVGQMDVVIVADQHAFPAVQAQFAAWMRGVREARPARPLAIVCEAVPAAWQSRISGEAVNTREAAVGALVHALREYWPWPLAGYERWAGLLPDPAPALYAGGLPFPLPIGTQPAYDCHRRPTMRVDDERVGGIDPIREVNRNSAAAVLAARVALGAEAQVWVLIGGSHILADPDGLLDMLREAGLRCCVLVPFEDAWEVVLRTSSARRRDAILEVLPSVYRVPLAMDLVLHAEACVETVGVMPTRR